MSRHEFEFRFEVEQAEADALALKDFFAQEFPAAAARVARRQSHPRRDGVRDAHLTISIFALVLSATSATKNAFDLAARFKLKEKVQRLIDWAKARRKAGQRNPFVVLPPDNKIVPLDQAQPDRLTDALVAHANPHPTAKP